MEISKRVDNNIREVMGSQMLWGLVNLCKTLAFTLKDMERALYDFEL